MLLNAVDWRAGCVAENEAQRSRCRMLQTGERVVWLRLKLKVTLWNAPDWRAGCMAVEAQRLRCRMVPTGEQAV